MFSGIVLAGGKSGRMGVDKRRVMFSGVSLLELSVNRLRSITDEIIVVTRAEENLDIQGVRFVSDVEKNRGPLIGLFSGLSEMNNSYALVTPVDTPLISTEFLNYLKEKAPGYDIAVPRWKRGIEPLVAVYSKNVIPAMEEWIRDEKKPAPHLFVEGTNLRVRFIEEDEILKFGNPEILFFNINTEEDLRKAEIIAGENV